MKLYWCPQTRSVRALWLMEEAGVPYERVRIDIRDPQSQNQSAFRAVSPMGKVPALEDGAVKIWDSGAISAYVADQYPQSRLAPPIGHPDRGRYLMWLMYTNSVLEPAMGERATGAKPAPSRNGWGSYDQAMDTLRRAVQGGPHVLGEQFSAADILLATSIYFMKAFKLMEPDPVLFAYEERCTSRPAFARAMEIETGKRA